MQTTQSLADKLKVREQVSEGIQESSSKTQSKNQEGSMSSTPYMARCSIFAGAIAASLCLHYMI